MTILTSTPASTEPLVPNGVTKENNVNSPTILDIRQATVEYDILENIHRGMRPEEGSKKTLPTLLLYDQAGLKMFEKITYLEEYYLTGAEILVLESYAERIAQRIRPGSIILELGSGNLRKVKILLDALEKEGKDVEYYALDLSQDELIRTLAQVPSSYRHVKCRGLHGTYDDGREWLKLDAISAKPKTILWLGSSIGNMRKLEAGQFLRQFVEVLQPGDQMLVGIDSCSDRERVSHAYNDREGVTHKFILNGLTHANEILGKTTFDLDDWEVIDEYDSVIGGHIAYVSPRKDVLVDGVSVKKGERIHIEESIKFSPAEIKELWKMASLAEGAYWFDPDGIYGLHMVSKPKIVFPTRPDKYAASPEPSLTDWHQLWTAWDSITQDMIPKDELLSKPIELRNAYIFYLGHIPTFLDIHLTRSTGEPGTDPTSYPTIFERGIDPDVDNPELCHAHSEIPDTWPPLDEILHFQSKVRRRVTDLYQGEWSPSVRRALWIGFEHEIMHLETLLYMLMQSEKTLPPKEIITPDFEMMAHQAAEAAVENKWFQIPEADIVTGMDEARDDPGRFLGWDNEIPSRILHVKSFRAKARPITNGEYAEYLAKTGTSIPVSWYRKPSLAKHHEKKDSKITNGNDTQYSYLVHGLEEVYVRTFFGPVPLKHAIDWPVIAPYDELAGCAKWMGGRIPTMEEVRSIYAYVEKCKSMALEKAIGKMIPAVNGHLSNEGVQESPPAYTDGNGSSQTVTEAQRQRLFINLEGANVGLARWHPVPVVHKGSTLCGQADLGGVWEWTSTVLGPHEGFQAMEIYPGYTTDFFDKKHNIVLGGSWATHPRVAGRKSFVNWYQRNYPYAWAGARLVQDN